MSYPVQMWKLGSIFIISAIFILTAPCVFCSTCGAHEYPTGPHTCCPMCEAGSYVFRHCEKSNPTVCEQCPTTTFTDEENGLLRCKSCTVCDSKAGLKVRRACSPTSDTLCEPLEGHWCTDPIEDGCLRAVEHTKCSPGQYVKDKGTAYCDTRCETCGYGTVSDGSSTSCRSHTQHDTDMEEHRTKRVASFSVDDCDNVKTGTAIAFVSFIATLIFTWKSGNKQQTGVSSHSCSTP
ncbi:tumor necrosis factor receptor superfamily member 14-like [Clupea harengus]|uniref:Tumor necrosis factor receptor superfamily member 14-like n=1 Tax=Clupea harengus TaxID=7950 RepID=A0A8M1KQV0_CLUHA|nr:tumor necrosis factor receptor superfamily member 14-like [Clupea harengus]